MFLIIRICNKSLFDIVFITLRLPILFRNLRNETIYLTLQRFALGLRLNYLCRKC